MKSLNEKLKTTFLLFLLLLRAERFDLNSIVDPEDANSNFNSEIVFPKLFGNHPDRSLETVFSNKFDPDKKYIITITGVTTSGKSSVASFIYKILKGKSKDIRPHLIHQDNYYKDDETIKRESKVFNNPLINNRNNGLKINYESPGAFKWTELKKNIIALLNNDVENFKNTKYQYSEGKVDEKSVEIPKDINVLIIEGLYAQNLFDENPLDVSAYDPCDTSKSAIGLCKKSDKMDEDISAFIKENNIEVLKFFIDLPNEAIRRNRLEVDKKRAKRSEKETKIMLNDFIIPACEKWIRPISSNAGYVFSSKSRNLNTGTCLSVILKYFDGKIDVCECYKAFLESFKVKN